MTGTCHTTAPSHAFTTAYVILQSSLCAAVYLLIANISRTLAVGLA